MEEFKEKQKRQRVIVDEKYNYTYHIWEIDKIFTNAKKCYKIHFRVFFDKCEDNKNVSYQKFLDEIKIVPDKIFYNGNFDGFGEFRVRFRYTIHQLE